MVVYISLSFGTFEHKHHVKVKIRQCSLACGKNKSSVSTTNLYNHITIQSMLSQIYTHSMLRLNQPCHLAFTLHTYDNIIYGDSSMELVHYFLEEILPFDHIRECTSNFFLALRLREKKMAFSLVPISINKVSPPKLYLLMRCDQ